MVTAEDVQRVEEVERELAASGREAERVAVGKALTLLRREVTQRLERLTGASNLPEGRLPSGREAPIRTLGQGRQERLSALLVAGSEGRLTPEQRRELTALLDEAERGAMGNALALIRDHAPESDLYVEALRAYKRSFAPRARRAAGSSHRSA